MLCSSSTLSLSIKVFSALLLVTIFNAYVLHSKFQMDSYQDIQERYARHIHTNPDAVVPPPPGPLNPPSLVMAPPPLDAENLQTKEGGGESKPKEEEKRDITDGEFPRDICMPHPTTQKELLELPITVITATSQGYSGHVGNLIGSVQTHHPGTEIVVYDLGLEPGTVAQIEQLCGVTVRKFNFDMYPSHVQNLRSFAWKALVVKQAVLDYGKIIYLDSGYEVRRPLDFIRGRVEREGYFCTGMGDSLVRGGREPTFNFMNMSTIDFMGLPQTAGGVHGVTYWGGAFQHIIQPGVECSLEPNCIDPPKPEEEVRASGKDQSVFSALVYKGGCTQCGMSDAFTAYTGSAYGDPFTVGKQVLFHKRGAGSFNNVVKQKDTCPDFQLKNYEIWQGMKEKYNVSFLGNTGCPHTRFSAKKDHNLYVFGDLHKSVDNIVESVRKEALTIVTASDSSEFEKLERLIGSVRNWEPHRKIVVYNVGLEDHQVQTISAIENVIVEPFDFGSYPEHVRKLANTAYRFIALSLAYEKYGSVFFLTPPHVLYQRLDTLIHLLRRDGIFTPAIGGDVMTEFSSVGAATKFFHNWPQVSEERRKVENGDALRQEFEFKPLCDSGVLGFWKDSVASKVVLPPLAECAKSDTCWNGAVTALVDLLRTDKVMVSLMIYEKVCYTCNRDYDFFAYAGKNSKIIHDDKSYNMFYESLWESVQVVYDDTPL